MCDFCLQHRTREQLIETITAQREQLALLMDRLAELTEPKPGKCRAAMLGMAGIGEDEAKRVCGCHSCKPDRTVKP